MVVRDVWGDPPGGLGTGLVILGKIRIGSGDPTCGPGWVAGPSQRSETGQGTLPEVWAG